MQHILQWLREFKTEAPWYFWAFASLTLLGLVYGQTIIVKATWVALLLGAILLKKFGILRFKWLYIFSCVASAVSPFTMFAGYDYALNNGFIDSGPGDIIDPYCYAIYITSAFLIVSLLSLVFIRRPFFYVKLLVGALFMLVATSLGAYVFTIYTLLMFAR